MEVQAVTDAIAWLVEQEIHRTIIMTDFYSLHNTVTTNMLHRECTNLLPHSHDRESTVQGMQKCTVVSRPTGGKVLP